MVCHATDVLPPAAVFPFHRRGSSCDSTLPVCVVVQFRRDDTKQKLSKKRKPEVKQLLKGVKDKKSRAVVLAAEERHDTAVLARSRAEMLLPEDAGLLEAEGMERTYRFHQDAMKDAVDVAAAKLAFDVTLPTYGPYRCSYSRNGRCV